MAAKLPCWRISDADGPVLATAEIIWEWNVFISSPFRAEAPKRGPVHKLSPRVTTPDRWETCILGIRRVMNPK